MFALTDSMVYELKSEKLVLKESPASKVCGVKAGSLFMEAGIRLAKAGEVALVLFG